MTASEIITELEKIGREGGADPEAAHSRADALLCEALRIAGMSDVVEAFDEARDLVGFWYA